MKYQHQIVVFIIIILVLFLISCGRGHRSSVATDNRSVLSNSGVSVTVFDNTGKIVTNPSEKYSLCVSKAGDYRQVVVALKQQDYMRTCFLEVQFDGTKEHPTEIQCGSALLKHQPLSYLGSPEAGKVVSAQVILGEKSIKVNGELLRIKLSAGSHLVRTVSGFNQNPASDPILADVSVDPFDINKIYWTYKLRGDANNNQIFDFADFGVVGEKFNTLVKSDPSIEPADANNNGTIDFADFGVIGANYGRGIGGVKIYRDDNPEPSTLLGSVSTNNLYKGDFTCDLNTQTILENGFKRFWFNENTISGQFYKLELVVLGKEYPNGLSQSINSEENRYKPKDKWSMFGHDAQHTCRSEYIGPATNSLKWVIDNNKSYSTPVIDTDGTIYVSCDDKKLYALNADGSIKWTYQDEYNAVKSPVLCKNGMILVVCYYSMYSNDFRLEAIDANGKFLWSVKTNKDISTYPVISEDGTIYIGCDYDKLYAVNPNGELKWTYQLENNKIYTPSIGYDGVVYFGSDDNCLYAINPDGSFKWSYETGGAIEASPAIGADGTIYIGSNDKKLYAFYPDGKVKWSFETKGKIKTTPGIASDGSIYFTCWDNFLYTVRADGTLKWTIEISLTYTSLAIGADDTIYLSRNKELQAISSKGTLIWTFQNNNPITTSPIIGSDGTVYLSNDNKIYAIGPGIGNTGLNPPMNVNASDGPSDGSVGDKIEITWSVPSAGPDPEGYSIYRSTKADGDYDLIGKVEASTRFYDTQIKNSNIYYYKVSSLRQSVESSLSIEDAGSLKNGIHPDMNPPINVEASDGSYSDKIELVWSKPMSGDSPDGYKIFRATSTSANFTNIAVVEETTSFEDKSINENTVYYYKLMAFKGTEESDFCKAEAGFVSFSEEQTNWWMNYVDRKHSGLSQYIGPASNTLKWNYRCQGTIYSSPGISRDGTVYIGTSKKFYAINPNGSEKWTIGSDVLSSTNTPVVGLDDTVYMSSINGYLYAVNPDGALKWKFKIDSPIKSSPVISADSIIYFVSDDNYLYAVFPDGTLKWMYKTGNNSLSSPSIGSDGTIYIGSKDNKLEAINPDGSNKWSYVTSSSVISTPVINNQGTIFIITSDNLLYAINPNGLLKLKYQPYYSSSLLKPAIGPDGTIYCMNQEGIIDEVTPNGFHKWSFESDKTPTSAPIVDINGTVYFASYSNPYNLCNAIDTNGNTIWSFVDSFGSLFLPVIGPDGTLYLTSEYGSLIAIGPGSGTLNLLPPKDLEVSRNLYEDKIIMNWSKPTIGEIPEGYKIYRSEEIKGPFLNIGTVNQDTFFTDKNVPTSKVYYYKISSIKGDLESQLTQEHEGFIKQNGSSGEWSMLGRERTHSNRSPRNGPLTNTLLSINAIKAYLKPIPIINSEDNIIFGTNYSGSIKALDRNGNEKWENFDTVLISTIPAIGNDGSFYAGTINNKLYSLYPNGATRWEYITDGAIYSSPSIGDDGTIYFGCEDYNVYAVYPNGELKWNFQISDNSILPQGPKYLVRSSPAIDSDNTVYISGLPNKLLAINSNGSLKWEFKTIGITASFSPAIGIDGTIYISDLYNFIAINPDGSLKWINKLSIDETNSPAIGADGTVYIGSSDSNLYAFNPDGSIKWKYNTPGAINVKPVVDAQNSVYFSQNKELCSLNPDGSLKWKYNSTLNISAPIICRDGSILAFTSYNNSSDLLLIGPGNGK